MIDTKGIEAEVTNGATINGGVLDNGSISATANNSSISATANSTREEIGTTITSVGIVKGGITSNGSISATANNGRGGSTTQLIAGENIEIINNVISVTTATDVEEDNTKPITSAAVYTEVGNINVLLKTI